MLAAPWPPQRAARPPGRVPLVGARSVSGRGPIEGGSVSRWALHRHGAPQEDGRRAGSVGCHSRFVARGRPHFGLAPTQGPLVGGGWRQLVERQRTFVLRKPGVASESDDCWPRATGACCLGSVATVRPLGSGSFSGPYCSGSPPGRVRDRCRRSGPPGRGPSG